MYFNISNDVMPNTIQENKFSKENRAHGQGIQLSDLTHCHNLEGLSLHSRMYVYTHTHTHTHICIYYIYIYIYIQFSSVAQSCPTLCDPMNRSTPGLPVHHQIPEFTQTHIHRVGDAIQPSHPLSSPSPPAPNPSQHQSLFQWVNSSHEVAKVLELQL